MGNKLSFQKRACRRPDSRFCFHNCLSDLHCFLSIMVALAPAHFKECCFIGVVRIKILTILCKIPQDMASVLSLHCHSTAHLFFAYSVPTTMASLLFLESARHAFHPQPCFMSHFLERFSLGFQV